MRNPRASDRATVESLRAVLAAPAKPGTLEAGVPVEDEEYQDTVRSAKDRGKGCPKERCVAFANRGCKKDACPYEHSEEFRVEIQEKLASDPSYDACAEYAPNAGKAKGKGKGKGKKGKGKEEAENPMQ